MSVLTGIYASNHNGDLIDPETEKCWNIPEDRKFFREMITGKSIICGHETFKKDWRGLRSAGMITVLARDDRDIIKSIMSEKEKGKEIPFIQTANDIPEALMKAKQLWKSGKNNPGDISDEIFCIGGYQTFESFAPFMSKIILTLTDCPDGIVDWECTDYLPEFIQEDLKFSTSAEDDYNYYNYGLWNLNHESKYKIISRDKGGWSRVEWSRYQSIEF